jgi:hypothetical protein
VVYIGRSSVVVEKLKLTGQNLDHVFNARCGCAGITLITETA